MLRRVVRVKLKVFVSVCGFPVDPGFYSFIGKFGAYDCAYASFPWKLNKYSYGVQFWD